MPDSLLLPTLVSLLPVLGFVALLLFLDSYKLVPPGRVAALLAAGGAAAIATYPVNGWLLQHLAIDLASFSRYVAPWVEESLKGAIILALLRRQRIGFLVDAAVAGFAVGCGFALVENLYALWRMPGAGMGTWVVRGFGTAVMHGGATAALALVSLVLLERREGPTWRAALPGLAIAAALHSAFNHLSAQPQIAALAALVVVPALLLIAYHRGERALAQWLGRGFDADAELLALIQSGALPDSPAGRYLATLRQRFDGPVVADLLCYLRLFTELALRAKGLLLMRENGFDVPADEDTRAKFAELHYLEGSIGRAGLLALAPLLPMRRKDLRQLHLVDA